MLTTLTAKLKLTTTPDQFAALRATQLVYRDALNQVSLYAFAHGKTSKRRRLQRDLYAKVRTQYTLPAQMACSVFRQVGATYQGLWTKAHKNAEARRKGYTKKRFRGLDQPLHYVSPTLSYVYGRDYSLRMGQQVSLLTLCGRIHVPYQGYDVAAPPFLQGYLGKKCLCQGGCRLHQSKLSRLRQHQQGEPQRRWSALCVPAVPLQPACRSGGSPQYSLASVGHPAGLGGHGAVVRYP